MELVRKSLHIARARGWSALLAKARRKLLPLPVHRPALQSSYASQALKLAERYDATPAELQRSRALLAAQPGRLAIHRLTWLLPHFEHADYGGIRTILRFAAGFAARHTVANTFVVLSDTGARPEAFAARIRGAFPALADANIVVLRTDADPAQLPPADGCVATHWSTAYAALKFNHTQRKFYFLQDFEPLFFPAGSTSAQAEATYRFGFYGIANTDTLRRLYQDEFAGQATAFHPCVDLDLFAPAAAWPGRPYTVFFYARPDHPRNGFELGATALRRLKQSLGDQVRIVAAGQRWRPASYGLHGVVENLGLLSYHETAALYQQCDAGLAMMFTRHPSYLPLELMASGCLVVANTNHATTWLLRDRENCLLAPPTPSCLADALAEGLRDAKLRRQMTDAALRMLRERYADWDGQIDRVYAYMCDPEARL